MSLQRLYSFLFTLLLLTACTKTPAEGDRWREGTSSEITPNGGGEEAQPRHRLLVEKYTGQECVNCPTAATLLEGLEAAHPDRLVVVSMHAAYTGQTSPELRSSVADRYARDFHIARSIPGVMLDRRSLSGGERYSTSSSRWTGEILQALQNPARLALSLQVASAEVGSAWDCTVDLQPVGRQSLASAGYRLTLWVVEDILAPQQTARGQIATFLHHHVLRSELASETITLGKPYRKTFTIPTELKERTKAGIVAFVTDLKTGEVLESILQPAPEASSSAVTHPEAPKEERPETTVKQVSFLDPATEQVISSGSLLEVKPERPLELLDGIAEVASPYVKLLLPKDKPGPFTVEVQATSHGAGKTSHGLRAVCLETCTTLEALSTSYQLKDYQPEPTHLIGVHYGFSPAFARRVGTYEVRLYVKQAGRTEASLTYRFTITAKDFAPEEKQPEKPQPPQPAPVPAPQPVPTPPAPKPLPPVAEDDIPEAKKSHVIAFDFTGQRCGYCYAALDNMNAAKSTLGDLFHPVAIQSRSFRAGVELLCDDYWMYHTFYKPSGFPNVFIGNTKEKVYHSYVQGRAKELIGQKPSVKLRLRATNTPTDVTLHFKALPNDGMTPPQDVEVLFLLVQNNLVAYQVNKGDDYSHQHVLRRGLNNKVDPENWEKWTWGDTYTYGAELSATYRLEDARYSGSLPIVPKDCEVLALLLDAKTKLILGVASAHLK